MIRWVNESGFHFDLVLIPALLILGAVWFAVAQSRYRRTIRRQR